MIDLAIPDWLDWEIVIVLAMAAAGIFTMWNDARAHRREADDRITLHERLAVLEVAVASQAPHTIAERVAELEGKMEAELLKGRIAEIVDARIEAVGAPDLTDRLSKLEQRVDQRTRDKRGRFTPPAAPGDTCEAT